MKAQELINVMEEWAPRPLQESYDNSGLLVGDPTAEVDKVLVTLDITEDVIREAITKSCKMIISHHPIIFGGLKRLTGKNYVERTVMMAVKHDIVLYAAHTNLDNVQTGVNKKIGELLGVENASILQPKSQTLKKLVVFVPTDHKEAVLNALFQSGAGTIGHYSEHSFQSDGVSSFKPEAGSSPYVGQKGIRHLEPEARLEVVLHSHQLGKAIAAMSKVHPYEEIAYDVYSLENTDSSIGSGMIGDLKEEEDAVAFLKRVKSIFGGVVRHTDLVRPTIRKIAWCGGSGSFLLGNARSAGADLFLSSDFKYHQFFDAENEIVIADIGHFENEQFTKDLIARRITEKFPNFAVLLTETNTNPINYI